VIILVAEEQTAGSQQWYSNKELFMMINEMNEQIIKLCVQIQNLSKSMEKMLDSCEDIEKVKNKLSGAPPAAQAGVLFAAFI
jgi:septal ring factor EnvC (AmiA/AmiB activator)